MRNRSAVWERPVTAHEPDPMPPPYLAYLCIRCATAGRAEHRCIENGGGGPYAYLRDWRCDCPCPKR